MKNDTQKTREKAQTADQCIASLEDSVRSMDTAVQVAKKTLSEHTLKMTRAFSDGNEWGLLSSINFIRGMY